MASSNFERERERGKWAGVLTSLLHIPFLTCQIRPVASAEAIKKGPCLPRDRTAAIKPAFECVDKPYYASCCGGDWLLRQGKQKVSAYLTSFSLPPIRVLLGREPLLPATPLSILFFSASSPSSHPVPSLLPACLSYLFIFPQGDLRPPKHTTEDKQDPMKSQLALFARLSGGLLT